MQVIKIIVLYMVKILGGFILTRKITSSGLRILCYHNFAFDNEFNFRPQLFMQPENFRKRMRYLAKLNFPVMSLESALDHLARDVLPARTTVITMDDGWHGIYGYALPVISEFRYPVTVYVTTYYVKAETQVFNVLVRYMFWLSGMSNLDVEGFSKELRGQFNLSCTNDKEKCIDALISFGNRCRTAMDREDLARFIAVRLEVDFEHIKKSQAFRMMTLGDIGELEDAGFDIQLHTHRHVSPDNYAEMEREVNQNREILEPALKSRLEHFCYPSGVHDPRQWPWLEALGVKSATTVLPGFNYPGTPRLQLRRFVDSDDIPSVVFEAEMSGFFELLRRARSFLRLRGPQANSCRPEHR